MAVAVAGAELTVDLDIHDHQFGNVLFQRYCNLEMAGVVEIVGHGIHAGKSCNDPVGQTSRSVTLVGTAFESEEGGHHLR